VEQTVDADHIIIITEIYCVAITYNGHWCSTT